MSGLELAPLLAVVLLGAVHGVNPAMGWLFAVGLGLQEKEGRAVWRALPPLAIGHALSVAVVVAVGALAGLVVPLGWLRWAVAAVLFTFGVHRLVRGHRHPRYGGMRMTRRELVIWSFLMASAHGAGLMVLPFVLGDVGAAAHTAHAAHPASAASLTGDVGLGGTHAAHAGLLAGQAAGLIAAFIHAASYLLVTTLIAVVVYHRVGLKMLRTAWINLDVIWAGALIATAILTPLV
jgi:hypothetical protein